MSDLLQEAKAELRRETAENTFKRSIPYFIGAAVIALVVGAGYQFWQKKNDEAIQAASIQYYAAVQKLQSGDSAGGIAALEEISKSAPQGMAALAALQRASALQESGDTAGALAAFDEAVKKAKDPDFADIARLRAAYIAVNTENAEKVSARLDAIISRKGPFALLATELKAANDWQHGKIEEAKAAYQLLQLDPNATQGLRERAGQALAVINSGATPSADLMPIAAQQPNGQPQTGAAPEQNVEIGADGKRIIRLPPGVKLPPGYKVPPNVRFIETPLTPEQANQANQEKNKMMQEVEAERRRAMAEQEAQTKAQQSQIEAITKAQQKAPEPQTNDAPTNQGGNN